MSNASRLGQRRRRLGFPALLSVGLVAIMVVAGLNVLAGNVRGSSLPLSSGPGAASSALAATAIAGAEASLAAGGGPAGGLPVACAAALGGEEATCAATGGGVVPQTAPGNIGTQKWESEVAPGARTGASMTYDGKDRYVLLFGGFNGTNYLNDTWEWGHDEWVQLAPGPSPSARANASLAYDAADRYVVLFGGTNTGGTLSDTWKYVAGAWTPLAPATSPSPREDATLTFDTADNYLVLFGGFDGHSALGDTWTFYRGQWAPAHPSSSPSPRWASVSTFDSSDNYLLLFGGYNGTQLFGDTWEFAGGAWTPLSPATSPSPRYEAGLTYDTLLGYALLFGGASWTGSQWSPDGDTWSYHSGTWTQIVPLPGVHPPGGKALPYGAPAPRQAFTMAYSTQTRTVVLFGGLADGDPMVTSPSPNTQSYGSTDTWQFNQSGWTQVLAEQEGRWAEMTPRVGAGIAYDPTAAYYVGSTLDRGYVVAFGGSTGYGPNGETWVFLTKPTATWSETFPTVSPSARSYAAMAYDPTDGYVVLFGGLNSTGAALGDTWTFQNGTWTQISPGLSPAARYGAQFTYDNGTGYLLLFGGTNGSAYFSDTWTFSGGVWSPWTSSKYTPTARAFGGLAWDSKTSYVVLFGGTTGASALNDTWKFVAGAWTLLHPKLSPPASWGMSLVYNVKSDDVFLFGGCEANSFDPLAPSCPAAETLGTAWQFRAAWSLIPIEARLTAIPAAPQARFLAAAVNDLYAPSNVILLFGGMTSSGVLIADRWNFQSNIWNPWAPPLLPLARYGAASLYDDRSQNAFLFGGIGQYPDGTTAYLNDTWEWDTGMWGEANPSTSPSARAFSGITYFGTMIELKGPTSYNFTVLFGGIGPNGYLGDTWRWVGSETGGFWKNVTPGVSPSARSNMSMAYDNADNEVILFGGQNASGYLGDTWAFTVAGTWVKLSPSVSPSARAGATMAYDHEDGYLLLFGGVGAGGALGDTWTFLHGAWSQLSTPSAPSPRYGEGLIDCPSLVHLGSGEPQVVLLVGGTNGSAFFGDTWAFVKGQWTQLAATAPGVTPFAFGALSNDLDDGHASLFGGITAGGIQGDFWEFKHGS